ncbi:MAG: TrbC/VirB2 family protein [Terriglobales bacterium]
MNCVWDNPLDPILSALDTPWAHGLVLILCLVSGIAWALSGQDKRWRKLCAIAFGGAVALALEQLLLQVLAV